MNKRPLDILAFFDHTRTSNGPTEAINDRLEHLRGTALGCRNLTNYTRRPLLDTQGFEPQFQRKLGRASKVVQVRSEDLGPQPPQPRPQQANRSPDTSSFVKRLR